MKRKRKRLLNWRHKYFSNYKNANLLAQQCIDKAEIVRKESLYQKGLLCIKKNSVDEYSNAIKAFEEICDYKDSSTLLEECRQKLEVMINLNKKKKRTTRIIVSIILIIVIVVCVICGISSKKKKDLRTQEIMQNIVGMSMSNVDDNCYACDELRDRHNFTITTYCFNDDGTYHCNVTTGSLICENFINATPLEVEEYETETLHGTYSISIKLNSPVLIIDGCAYQLEVDSANNPVSFSILYNHYKFLEWVDEL